MESVKRSVLRTVVPKLIANGQVEALLRNSVGGRRRKLSTALSNYLYRDGSIVDVETYFAFAVGYPIIEEDI